LGIRLITQAIVTDPSNIRLITERGTRPLRYQISTFTGGIFARAKTVQRRIFQLNASVFAVPERYLGRIVERVFTRGNRDLALKIESLQQSVRAADELGTSLARGMESLRNHHEERVAILERAIIEGVAALEDRITSGHSSILTALELLRSHQEQRISAVEHATMGELARLENRIAQHHSAIVAAEDRITQDRTMVMNMLESLQSQQEALRKELKTAQELLPKSSSVLGEVYGTPPTLRPIPGWHTYWGIENRSNGFLRDRVKRWASLSRPVLMRWLGDLLVVIWPGNELSRVLFLTGNFEPNELTWVSQTLTDGMTMIDVGAHIGMYTLVASKLVGDSGLVIAIEPSTREFQRLTTHVTLNDLRNVRCLQVGASSTSGSAPLKIACEWNSGHNTFGDFFNPEVDLIREEPVLMQTLDAIVSAQKLERVDLIKIDVEGHELKVLTGALETITRFRPRVLIEVFEETLRRQGASVEAVLSFLIAQGYVLNEFSDFDGSLVPLRRPLGNESRNLVALPIG
jgi:FkbM family methyltransferase